MLPPPQTGKRDPLRLKLDDLIEIFASEEQHDERSAKGAQARRTHQVLTAHLLGMSPLLAKEIVFRAAGKADQKAEDVNFERLHSALHDVVDPLGRRMWQPGVCQDERGQVTAYSVYLLTCIPGWHRVDSISQALTVFYSAPVGEEAYTAGKQPIRDAIAEARAKLSARLASLR
ncbi:MAG: hypothetical protein CUN53_18950, partial [Phototrophicales bacterium]